MEITSVKAIKEYFGRDRPVMMEELRELSKEERAELGAGAAKAMGMTITAFKEK